MSFSFEQLRGFVAVAEQLHFGRAAEQLSMTQPPLSRQIQKLERAVGAELLQRDHRRVELTAAGAAFLVEARRLLSLAGAAPDLARRIAAGSAGTVRLGFTAAATFRALPDLLTLLARRLPDLDVELHEMITGDQTDALAGGELDAGLARPWFDPAVLGSRLVERADLMVAVPAGHRLAARTGPVHPEELADEPLIMHSPGEAPYLHQLVASAVPARRNVVHTVSQLITMVSLVSAGRGLALLPAPTAGLRVEHVVYLPLVPPAPEVELHLLWPRDSPNPALSRVLDALNAA